MEIHCFSVIFGAVLLNCAAPFPSANATVEVHVLCLVSFIFHQPKRLQVAGAAWEPGSFLLTPYHPLQRLAKPLLIFLLVACPCFKL